MRSDPYVYPGTSTLINKFNIRDPDKLEHAESVVFFAALSKGIPEGRLDYMHLKSIHRHFFARIYPWAGEERTVNISKGNSLFGGHQFIAKELNKVFERLAKEDYLCGIGRKEFCRRLSGYFNDINAAHPFREGNGRTLRAFCDKIAEKAGFRLEWDKISRESWLGANIAGFNGDNEPMIRLFNVITKPHILKLSKISKENEGLDVLSQKFPVVAEYRKLLKDREQAVGFRAEKLDKQLSSEAKRIIQNKEIFDAIINIAPKFASSLNACIQEHSIHFER